MIFLNFLNIFQFEPNFGLDSGEASSASNSDENRDASKNLRW